MTNRDRREARRTTHCTGRSPRSRFARPRIRAGEFERSPAFSLMSEINIRENYQDYIPPFDVPIAIKRLVSATPAQYLAGLASIVLKNQGAVTRRKRRIRFRGRKVPLAHCNGLYYQKTNVRSAWIELYVDTIIPSDAPLWLWRLRFVQDLFLSDSLFHEIGHHVDYTIGGKEQDSESAAERWRKELKKQYARKRYWYLRPFVKPIRVLLKIISLVMSLVGKIRNAGEQVTAADSACGSSGAPLAKR